jgi:hypothetical protein
MQERPDDKPPTDPQEDAPGQNKPDAEPLGGGTGEPPPPPPPPPKPGF